MASGRLCQVYYYRQGSTLTVWFGDPRDVYLPRMANPQFRATFYSAPDLRTLCPLQNTSEVIP